MITGIFLGVLCLATLAAVRPLARAAQWHWQDAALIAALLPVALYSVRPYVGTNVIGAGDSHHYALQIADFIAQERLGLRPIMVGGSDYQFNGGVHTIRTAPYFTHLAGLLDLLTLRRLTAVQLQNLVVATTAMLAAIAAYLAALHASGRRRFIAWLLAAVYVLSPAIYGPLTLMDMFATYMAAPMLVIGWLGLVGIVERADNRVPHLVAAGALAVMWYAHSPIAAWFTLWWMFALAVACFRPGRWQQNWRAGLTGAALFGAMAAYVWISLATLNPGPPLPVAPPFAEFSWVRWRAVVGEALQPYASGAPFALQFGLPLWLLLFAGLALLIWQRRAAALLIVPVGLMVLLVFPWPVAAEPLWRALPSALVAQMTWPGQRFYPLLAGAAIVLCAVALRNVGTRWRWIPIVPLVVALGWSLWQMSLLHARPGVAVVAPAVHEPMFAPQNLALSRYSYAFFERLPPYFTHGWTEPEFELRLLNPAGEVTHDNARAILAAAGPGEFKPITIESLFTLEGGRDYLVVFSFAAPDLRGEVVVHAPGIRRAFTLPSAGEPQSFGAGPDAAKTIPLFLRQPGDQPIVVAATVPGVSYRIVPINRDTLPIRLLGNTPLRAQVRAPAAGYLETPRMWIEGYSAKVNDRPTPTLKSPRALVMIPIAAGESLVVLDYSGPIALRLAWYLSLFSLAAWPWLLIWFSRPRR